MLRLAAGSVRELHSETSGVALTHRNQADTHTDAADGDPDPNTAESHADADEAKGLADARAGESLTDAVKTGDN